MLHIPPFGKGRIGGILQNNVVIILRLLICIHEAVRVSLFEDV
jgi:hypothetical protein